MNQEIIREEKASRRVQIILPLTDSSLDPAKLKILKEEISRESGISVRTLERYLAAYQKESFEGLKPKKPVSSKTDRLPKNFDEIFKQAVILRRELPQRSVAQIIRILEMENLVKPGELKRSTLQDHLQTAGFGAKQMRVYSNKGLASRRFQKSHRCMLFQGDIKIGPYLPIGPNRSNKQVFLAAFIDDATRYIVSARLYDTQKIEIIEDCLRRAVMNFGIPDSIYVDNGKQYRSKWLQKACDKLGIRLRFTKPYSPQSKGKIEFFNRTLDSFLAELVIDKPLSLDEANQKLVCWIDLYYHQKEHSGLGGKTPELVFKSDTRPLKFADSKILADAFLHSEERQVDKTGCISLFGYKYEAGMDLVGRKAEIIYDPLYLEEIEIHVPDKKPYRVKQIEIGEWCGVRQTPKPAQSIVPDHSRMLAALQNISQKHQTARPALLSFRDLKKEDSHD